MQNIKCTITYAYKVKNTIKTKRCTSCCVIRRERLWREKIAAKIALKKESIDYIPIESKRGIIYYHKDKHNTLVENMQNNNPMFSKETKEKVSKTIRENIQNGVVVYKKGKDHHLWQGNRDNNHTIRTRLKDWRKTIMKKYYWKCNICKSNKKLEVHHSEPLRDIITKFTNKPLSEYENDSDEFDILSECVVNYHYNNDVGVLLCEKCHSEVDEFRRQTMKNENKKNNN